MVALQDRDVEHGQVGRRRQPGGHHAPPCSPGPALASGLQAPGLQGDPTVHPTLPGWLVKGILWLLASARSAQTWPQNQPSEWGKYSLPILDPGWRSLQSLAVLLPAWRGPGARLWALCVASGSAAFRGPRTCSPSLSAVFFFLFYSVYNLPYLAGTLLFPGKFPEPDHQQKWNVQYDLYIFTHTPHTLPRAIRTHSGLSVPSSPPSGALSCAGLDSFAVLPATLSSSQG